MSVSGTPQPTDPSLTPLWAWFRVVPDGWYDEVIRACTLDPSRYYRGWGFIRWRESCSI